MSEAIGPPDELRFIVVAGTERRILSRHLSVISLTWSETPVRQFAFLWSAAATLSARDSPQQQPPCRKPGLSARARFSDGVSADPLAGRQAAFFGCSGLA